jgi:hypothetical protein
VDEFGVDFFVGYVDLIDNDDSLRVIPHAWVQHYLVHGPYIHQLGHVRLPVCLLLLLALLTIAAGRVPFLSAVGLTAGFACLQLGGNVGYDGQTNGFEELGYPIGHGGSTKCGCARLRLHELCFESHELSFEPIDLRLNVGIGGVGSLLPGLSVRAVGPLVRPLTELYVSGGIVTPGPIQSRIRLLELSEGFLISEVDPDGLFSSFYSEVVVHHGYLHRDIKGLSDPQDLALKQIRKRGFSDFVSRTRNLGLGLNL